MRVDVFAAPKLERVLKHLAKIYHDSPEKEALAVPYVITCAAALEAKLNDAIVRHTRAIWRTDGTSIRQAYLSMSFAGKLELLPILLTTNQFRLNREDEYVKRLFALISTRNLLVHPKPSSHEVKTDRIPDPFSPGGELTVPDSEFWDLLDDLTFGSKHQYSPEDYHEALNKLEELFFERLPNKLENVPLLRPRSEA